MSIVGQIEKKTQARVVRLFREQLSYDYLGDWTDREGNRNIEEELLRRFLREKQSYDETLITRTLYILDKAAGDTGKSLYDRNRAVYDLVLYVNGIALGVLELKRSTVSVAEGIRQNLDNQKKVFIEHFFSTIQWVMAGNDPEGLRYGAIKTPEKYYLKWKEESPIE